MGWRPAPDSHSHHRQTIDRGLPMLASSSEPTTPCQPHGHWIDDHPPPGSQGGARLRGKVWHETNDGLGRSRSLHSARRPPPLFGLVPTKFFRLCLTESLSFETWRAVLGSCCWLGLLSRTDACRFVLSRLSRDLRDRLSHEDM